MKKDLRTQFDVIQQLKKTFHFSQPDRRAVAIIDRLIIQVEQGIVTLEGEVIREYQFTTVEKARNYKHY